MSTCCSKTSTGPGYPSPKDAMANGPRERALFVTCVRPDALTPDYLATVDVDPQSRTYGQVVGRTEMTHLGDELHHSGWNTCSSCNWDSSKCRNRLILPCLNSDRIYVVRVAEDSFGYKTTLDQVIHPGELHALGVSAPHTTHCLPNGKLMISTLGTISGAGRGAFVLLEQTKEHGFQPTSLWNHESVTFGYDYWYQPRHDILVSTEWGAPEAFKRGFNLEQVDQYGSSLHFWSWTSGELIQSLNLASLVPGTKMPLEIRFLHDPEESEGYVGCALEWQCIPNIQGY